MSVFPRRLKTALLVAGGLLAVSPITVVYANTPRNHGDFDHNHAFQAAASVPDKASVSADPKTVKTAAADINFPEGAGIYATPGDGALGRDLWQGSNHADLESLLEHMPASSPVTGVQSLIFGALLTDADSSGIKETAHIPEGKDLLTLRLAKLIEAGAYAQAMDLYSSLKLPSPPPAVAKYGILAMLYTGQLSLSCVELNILPAHGAIRDYFKPLQVRCNDSGKPYEGPAPETLYARDKFSGMSVLDKAMIMATSVLKMGTHPDKTFRDIPPADLQLVLKAVDLTPEDKFYIKLRAVDWGLMRVEDLRKDYERSINLDLRHDPALSVPAGIPGWQKLPYFLQIANNRQSNTDKWQFLRQAIEAAAPYGTTALLPFADLVKQITPEKPTLREIEACINILVKSGNSLPPGWVSQIENHKFSPGEEKLRLKLKAAAYLANRDNPQNSSLLQEFKAYETKTGDLSTRHIQFIIENIDKSKNEGHNQAVIYENKKGLTNAKDYVMQSGDVSDRLFKAVKNGLIGETVLISAAALYEMPLDKINPGQFMDTLRSLKNVGLTDISENIAMMAVVGNIE